MLVSPSKPSGADVSIQRRLFHLIVGSSIPLLALVLPHSIILVITGGGALFSLLGEVIRLRYLSLNQWLITKIRILLKQEESSRLLGSTYLLIGMFLSFLWFQTDIAITALLFITIGDPGAAIVGSRFGRRRLFKKSLEGSLAMLVAAIIVAVIMMTFRGLPYVPLLAGAVVATAVEALPLPLDDNLTVPVCSGITMSQLLL